ncbi:MAG: NYN domain-containing protein [Syntrophorhabdaceae bacterium]|nr:NYN domain-containing protein [Syntrophorhabdaceae bacterium]MDD5242637.1 NYN domain-containing protein [Syntrophorhabdaceae bacterium]
MMPLQPSVLRTISFIDGQNLFYAVKEAFGYSFPNYDPLLLSKAVCNQLNCTLHDVYFYTGVPDPQDDAFWNHFWAAKLAQMGRTGVKVYSRPLRYRNQTVRLSDRSPYTFLVGQEKGVDVRLALDVVRLARKNLYDICVIFSQDQDLTEAVDEVKRIAAETDRWIKVICAFPYSPASKNKRGIDKTDWVKINRTAYDQCIDRRDYRPKTA